MTSLNFEKVSVQYGQRQAVVEFSEVVRPGEWLCLIGPNGAGKSSLLQAIVGIVSFSGNIVVDGATLKR